jgi:hypothetical protein
MLLLTLEKDDRTMNTHRFNWQLWAGFVLSVAAFLSYPFFFVNFPVTRDFPWANALLFAIAVMLLTMGVRRAFASNASHPTRAKIVGSLVATFSLVVIAFFVFTFFVMARWLPASHDAPRLGQKAPDFTLVDIHGKPVSLSELLTTAGPAEDSSDASVPASGQTPNRGVLLVFYRGYW